MKLSRRHLTLAGAALLLGGKWTASRSINTKRPALLPDPGLLAPGDWFFRRTNSVPGLLSRQADPDSPFSHVGIVSRSPDGWRVVHATPADETGAGGVRADPVHLFAEHLSVSAIAVARCINATTTQRQKMAAAALGFIGRPFDGLFDGEDESKLYCTELVWRAATAAKISLNHPFRPVTTLFGRRTVITLSALTRQPGLEWQLRGGIP